MNTEKVLGCHLLSRIPPGEEVDISPGTLVAFYGERRTQVFLPGMWAERLTIPADGLWYAVNVRVQRMEFGLARLGQYAVTEYPGKRFWFGIHGEFSVSIAHIVGLRMLMGSPAPEYLSLREAYLLSQEPIRRAVANAVSIVNGSSDWEYNKLRLRLSQLSQECWRQLFPVFYKQGLLLTSKQFRVNGITAPMLSES